MKLLSVDDVYKIHETVINSNELQGFAGGKSLDSVLSRVENRIRYGMINDVFDLASTYAVVIAVGHVFCDANKRTAFETMDICLRENGITLKYETQLFGDIIIRVAQGLVDEVELSQVLRNLT